MIGVQAAEFHFVRGDGIIIQIDLGIQVPDARRESQFKIFLVGAECKLVIVIYKRGVCK